MDTHICSGRGSNGSGSLSDYRFAFDDSNFSDRVLKIEVVPDLPELKTEGGLSLVVDWARKRKRRREEINRRGNDADMVMQHDEQVVNCTALEVEDGLADDEREEEA